MPNRTVPTLEELLTLNKVQQTLRLTEVNQHLNPQRTRARRMGSRKSARQSCTVIELWYQAAVMLHLLTSVKSDIPVVLTDTGYLFPETYQFIDELTERLNLNLKVYSAPVSAAWQEARYGKLWKQGVEGIERYNQINKVEPMRRALDELNISTWFSGLRREQSQSRASLPILSVQNGVFKFLPVIDWTNKEVHYYLKDNDLPYHPLWEQGYLSVGDTHTTQKWQPGMSEEQTRFFGLKRECGLHEDDSEHQ